MFRPPFDSHNPPACLFGRTPCRIGIVRSGLWREPEASLHAWFDRALSEAPAALPAGSVRFVVAPHDTPLLGVWIASRDACGRAFPLLYARRVLGALQALPWPLLLTAGAQLLAAAESCLLWARGGEIEPAWQLLAELEPPGPIDLANLHDEAERELAGDAEQDRRRARLAAAVGGAEPSRLSALELPAESELDACAWLASLRELHPAAPRGLFWTPARARLLVSLRDPTRQLLERLAAPHSGQLQTFPSIGLVGLRGGRRGAPDPFELRSRYLQLVAADPYGLAEPPRAPSCRPLPERARAFMPPPLERKPPNGPAAWIAASAADPSCYTGGVVFWKRTQSQPDGPEVSEQLVATVRAQLSEPDDDTVRIVAAISGLLACVAYSDRQLSAEERAHVRDVLGRVHGMAPGGPDAICALLERHVTELTMINPQAYTRSLREHTDKQMRLEVLDVLVELAAVDGELAFAETQLLRRLTSALGLEQDDYNRAQAAQRDRT